MRLCMRGLYFLGFVVAFGFLFPLPALADDCSTLYACYGTVAAALAASIGIGVATAGIGVLWGAAAAGAAATASSSPPGSGVGAYGHDPFTPQESERRDPPIEYDPWGQAIVSGVGDLAKLGVETGVEAVKEAAGEAASQIGELATHEAVGYGGSTVVVEPIVDKVVDAGEGETSQGGPGEKK